MPKSKLSIKQIAERAFLAFESGMPEFDYPDYGGDVFSKKKRNPFLQNM